MRQEFTDITMSYVHFHAICSRLDQATSVFPSNNIRKHFLFQKTAMYFAVLVTIFKTVNGFKI